MFQCLGTPLMSDVSKVFKHSRSGACQRRRAAFACVTMLVLGNFAVGQSNRLKQTASISDIPQTSKGAPASIVTNPGATGAVYVVNSDGSVLSINGGDGRTPATDVSGNCSLAVPLVGLAGNTEASGIGGDAAITVMQDKIYSAAEHFGVEVLNVTSADSCQSEMQISGTENAQLGLIARDAVTNKIYGVATSSDNSFGRVLIIDGTTDTLDAAIPSVNLDHSANYSSIVVDSAGLSPTHVVFVSEYNRKGGGSDQIWVIDPSSGSTLKIPGYAGKLFIIPSTERGGAELVVAGDTTVNVFSIADISFAGPSPCPVSSGTYNVALLGSATEQPKNAVLSSPVLDTTHRTLYGDFNGTIQGDLPAQVLLSVDLDTLSAGANNKEGVGTSLGRLGSLDPSNFSGALISYALAVDPGNDVVYAIPLSASPVSSSLNTGANILQAFAVSEGSVYTVELTAPGILGSTTGPLAPLAPSLIGVAQDGKVYVPGASKDAVSGRTNYSVAVVEYSAVSTVPAVTATTLVAAPTTVVYGTKVTYTATVTSTSGVPTGSVNFISGGATLATVTLNSAGVATFATNGGKIGTNTVYAQYMGNSDFASSSSNQTVVTVETIPTATSLSTPTPTAFVTTYVVFNLVVKDTTGTGVPTGIIYFYYDGILGGGIATLNSSGVATSGNRYLAPGTHTIQAQYAGDSTHASSKSNTITVTILPEIPTTTTLSTDTPSAVTGADVIFNIVVKGTAGTGVPTGIVYFYYDGILGGGIATLNSSGVATSGNRYLTPGTHTIQAQYAGDSTHASSKSNTIIVNIVDFIVTANPDTLTIAQGKAGTAILTVKSIADYDEPVQLQCLNRPANTTCKFSESVVTPTPGGATTKVTITTDRSPIYSELQSNPTGKPGLSEPLTALAGTGFAGLVLLLGLRGRKRLRTWNSVLLSIVLIGTLMSLTSSCGFQNPKTPPGSYTVKITSIGTLNGTEIEHTTFIQVTVSQ